MEYEKVKLVSMNNEESREILIALEYQMDFIKKRIESCKKYSTDYVEYWEKRFEKVQNVHKSLHQKIFPNLELEVV